MGAAYCDRELWARIWLDTQQPIALVEGDTKKTVWPAAPWASIGGGECAEEKKLPQSGELDFDLLPSSNLSPAVPYLFTLATYRTGETRARKKSDHLFGPAYFWMPNKAANLGELLRREAQAPARATGAIGYRDLYIEGTPSETAVVGYDPAGPQLEWREEAGGLRTDMGNLDGDLTDDEKAAIRRKLAIDEAVDMTYGWHSGGMTFRPHPASKSLLAVIDPDGSVDPQTITPATPNVLFFGSTEPVQNPWS